MTCPACGKSLDRGGCDRCGQPVCVQPGTVSVCAGCGVVLRFDATLQPYRLSAEQIACLPPGMLVAIAAVQRAILVRRHAFN